MYGLFKEKTKKKTVQSWECIVFVRGKRMKKTISTLGMYSLSTEIKNIKEHCSLQECSLTNHNETLARKHKHIHKMTTARTGGHY